MKVVKTAAIVVGAVALAATGIGAVAGLAAGIGVASGVGFGLGTLATLTGVSAGVFGAAALATGVGLAMSLLPKPSQGGSQTKWKADPYAGLPYVMGRTLVSGNLAAKRGSGGSNPYQHFLTILSICTIFAIEASFATRTTLNFGAGGTPVSGFYRERIWQRSQLGLCPEPEALQPWVGTFPGWSPQHKLSGKAATLVTMLYDASGKNQLTTEPQMAWIVQGVLVYDPRRDSTYPGGSGPCRAYDESTYVYSEDPHLHGLTFAMGRFQNGKRVFGLGGKATHIDIASFVEGANLNDARRWKVGGQIQSRPDTPWNNLKSILQAGGATPVLIGGIISCLNRAPRVSLATITHVDIVGDCSFTNTQPRRGRINTVIPMYRSEAHDWQMVSGKAVSDPTYVAQDGDERTREIQFPLVQDVDQATMLAAYEVCDAREAGPGSVPLGPWWLNYKIGDCVTFTPEESLSVKVMITGRGLEPQSGVVTYDVKSETDDKHPFALGQTGTAPPTASLAYDTGVAAPAAEDWTLSGATLSAPSGSIPAIVAVGHVGNSSADAVLFDYRLFVEGQGEDDGWNSAGVEAATSTRKEVTSVTPGTGYQMSVRYRVRGQIGDRLVLGPVTAGNLTAAGSLQMAIYNSFVVEVTAGIGIIAASADGTVTIANHTRRYTDGHADVAVTGGTIATGLTAGSIVSIAYDDGDRAGGVVAFAAYEDDADAFASAAHPARHYIGFVTVPVTGTSTGGGGGAGGGRENACVVDDTMFLTANADGTGPGETKAISAITPEDRAWTQHEVTREWGAFRVFEISFHEADLFESDGLPPATGEHQFDRDGWWKKAKTLGQPAGRGRVAKVTVEDARTYVTVQPDGRFVLNHNIKQQQNAE